jgi:hypothetical protein
LNKSDVHHIFPRNYLKGLGMKKGQYNQIANYAITQSEINIAIGDKPPEVYFKNILKQCSGGRKVYGGIVDSDELASNFAMHCIPEGMENRAAEDYDGFLEERRKLMAQKIKRYFKSL